MKNPALKNVIAFCSLLFMAGIFFASCSNSDDASFMSTMESIDIFIKNGDTAEAMRLLKKSEKKAYSSFARIGIFRRYRLMGEDKRAEKVLSDGLKKLPENPKLSATYAHFLLRTNRIDDAINISKCLESTKYGSLRSEAIMKKLLQSESLSDLSSPFFSREISSAYYDTYVGTNDSRWLRNCALIYLLRGEYSMASSLQRELEDSQDALFWAYVPYDSGNYDIAAENLESVSSPLLLPSASMLASDSYMMLGDEESAEASRNKYISSSQNLSSKMAPSVLVNSSLYAFRHEQYRKSYEHLIDAMLS